MSLSKISQLNTYMIDFEMDKIERELDKAWENMRAIETVLATMTIQTCLTIMRDLDG